MAASHHIPSERDLELLSTYLDGELNDREHEELERRLAQDVPLRTALDELRGTIALLHGLPPLKAPRDFTLDPAHYSERPGVWWQRLFTFENTLQITGALGAAASVVLIVLTLLTGTISDNNTKRDSPVSGSIALQPSPLPNENVTATTLDEDIAETAIAYAADDLIQVTIVAQSTLYAGTPAAQAFSAEDSTAELETGIGMAEAEEAEDAAIESEALADGEADFTDSYAIEEAPAPQLYAEPAESQTFGADVESGSISPEQPNAAAPALAAPPSETQPDTQTANQSAMEGDISAESAAGAAPSTSMTDMDAPADGEDSQTALREKDTDTTDDNDNDAGVNEQGAEDPAGTMWQLTPTPQPMVQAPLNAPTVEETMLATTESQSDNDTEEIPLWLAGIGIVLLIFSLSIFALGYRKAHA